MFEWGHSQQITCFRSPGNSRVTRIRFNYQGNKVRQLKAQRQTENVRAARVNQLFCVCFTVWDRGCGWSAQPLADQHLRKHTQTLSGAHLFISPMSDIIPQQLLLRATSCRFIPAYSCHSLYCKCVYSVSTCVFIHFYSLICCCIYMYALEVNSSALVRDAPSLSRAVFSSSYSSPYFPPDAAVSQ